MLHMRGWMTTRMTRVLTVVGLIVLLASSFLGIVPTPAAQAASSFGDSHFQETWAYTDQPIIDGKVNRTWMWGPAPYTQAFVEPYWDSTTGWRLIQYFDKSRMEITDPSGDQSSIWYVTNGLLAKELITGNTQLGDNMYAYYQPAQVNVAGDANDANGPTYSTFNSLMGASALGNGTTVTQTVNRAGTVATDSSLTSQNVTATEVGAPTKHTVASVFWSFMNSSGPVDQNGTSTRGPLFQNPFYATGYPLTEPYWTHVLVGGTTKLVLVQVFERRVLTFTPDNPSGWQVEAGNVGQHYYNWRFNQLRQPTISLLELASTPADSHSCEPNESFGHYDSLLPLYTGPIALDYRGTRCQVFHSEYGAWWDTTSGIADIYNGPQPTGTPVDSGRTFSTFSMFRNSNLFFDYNWSAAGFTASVGIEDPQGSFCGNASGLGAHDAYGVSAGYEHNWTPGVYISSVAYSPVDNYSIGLQTVYSNPPQTTTTSTACPPAPCDVVANPNTTVTGFDFERRLDIAFNFSVDSQTVAPYMFAVHGGDISQYDLTQVVQGPPGSTVTYHGGNCFYLYMSPSTQVGPQNVTFNDPGGSSFITSFYYFPTIGDPPPVGNLLEGPDMSQWPVEDTATDTTFFTDGAFHIQTHRFGLLVEKHAADTYGIARTGVDVRLNTPGKSSVACLYARLTYVPTADNLAFCLLSSGKTVVSHYTYSEGSEWHIPLFDRMTRPGTNAVTDWNRLEIVTQGDVYWFLINGTVIGSIQDARIGPSGKVGFWTENTSDGTSEWSFKIFTINALQ